MDNDANADYIGYYRDLEPMIHGKYHLLFGLAVAGGAVAVYAGFRDVGRPGASMPSVAVTQQAIRMDTEMPKTTPTMTPQPISGPISIQNSGSGESGAVRDVKPAANNVLTQEPREINPLNRVPIKKIDPNAVPSKDGAISPKQLPKKKRVRKKKP